MAQLVQLDRQGQESLVLRVLLGRQARLVQREPLDLRVLLALAQRDQQVRLVLRELQVLRDPPVQLVRGLLDLRDQQVRLAPRDPLA